MGDRIARAMWFQLKPKEHIDRFSGAIAYFQSISIRYAVYSNIAYLMYRIHNSNSSCHMPLIWRFLARRAQETKQRRALFNAETDAEEI